MPLDGHAHLVSQGWSGKGNGLRHGAIKKPVTIIQKKTLAGIGKDRDEAFPFWDHVFQAAAVSISVKVHNSDDESDSEQSSTLAPSLKRTSTGIISNRRPTSGTPALSGTTTPSESQASGSGSVTPRLSIMAAAKQQAARRMLYSMFYRGPVLTNEDEKAAAEEPNSAARSSSASLPTISSVKDIGKVRKDKKRKADMVESREKQERKRQKREAKARERKGKAREGKASSTEDITEGGERLGESDDVAVDLDHKAARKAARAERRRRKEEKRARKEERRKRKLGNEAAQEQSNASEEEGREPSPSPTDVVMRPPEQASSYSPLKKKKKKS
ncbi:hypothetical protein C8Q80DRAFT_1266630 [Daedaleopsis nitida]|nr:hypothetical protein C8Q80DRAFT_1266630 [Daedaleopsis nitida]